MIKIVSFERDAVNLDNVRVTISYDINEVVQPDFVIDAPMTTIMAATLQEVKDYIIAKVAEQRGTQLWGSVQARLQPYVGVDLEAV